MNARALVEAAIPSGETGPFAVPTIGATDFNPELARRLAVAVQDGQVLDSLWYALKRELKPLYPLEGRPIAAAVTHLMDVVYEGGDEDQVAGALDNLQRVLNTPRVPPGRPEPRHDPRSEL